MEGSWPELLPGQDFHFAVSKMLVCISLLYLILRNQIFLLKVMSTSRYFSADSEFCIVGSVLFASVIKCRLLKFRLFTILLKLAYASRLFRLHRLLF